MDKGLKRMKERRRKRDCSPRMMFARECVCVSACVCVFVWVYSFMAGSLGI